MKKLIIGFIIFIMSSMLIMSAEENPFASFMGVKWGWNASIAADILSKKYEIKEIGSGGVLDFRSVRSIINDYGFNIQEGFYIKNLELGNLTVEFVIFGFESSESKIKWKEKNFAKFDFSNVTMMISPNEFESMLDILKSKYGEPKGTKEYIAQIPVYQEKEIRRRYSSSYKKVMTPMNQQEVMWKNEDRTIVLQKYSESDGDECLVYFDKIDDNKKEAEDVL